MAISMSQGMYDINRPHIEYRSCDGCNRPEQECVRFGRSMYLCIACETLMQKKIKLILKLE